MSFDPPLKDALGETFRVSSDTIESVDGAPLDHPAEVQLFGLVDIDGDDATRVSPATTAKQDAALAALAAILSAVDGLEGFTDGLEAAQASILAKLAADPATQTTLAAVLAKLSSDPATQTTLAAVLAKLSSDPATQTTLAAVLAKLTADPATGAKQDTGNTALAALAALIASGALKTRETSGTFGYSAGTAAATIDVPTGARIKRVNLVTGSGAGATVTILGGNAITIPASGSFDEQIPGDCLATSAVNEIVITGSAVSSYYVAWVA